MSTCPLHTELDCCYTHTQHHLSKTVSQQSPMDSSTYREVRQWLMSNTPKLLEVSRRQVIHVPINPHGYSSATVSCPIKLVF